MDRKGILLAGGSGTRLYPSTKSISKQLLPIYDKPMIYYSLSILMLANIRDILLIVNERDKEKYVDLLGDGSSFGVTIDYEIQPSPDGIAQALLIGEKFIDNHPIALVLGDNLFYGQGLVDKLNIADSYSTGATIFGYQVKDPSRFGIVEFDQENRVISIEEKPIKPKSNFAIAGLYYFDNNAVSYAKMLKPSMRGELEISDLNNIYLKEGKLKIELLGRGFAWLDTGTNDSLIEAAQFVQTIEHRQGFKIACLEEIAYRNNWISAEELLKQSASYKDTPYGRYLHDIVGQSNYSNN